MGILADSSGQLNADVFGAKTVNPWLGLANTAVGGFFGGLGGGKSAAPQNAESTAYVNADHDGSNWTVATGGSSASGGGKIPWYVWAIVGVVALKYVKKAA